MFLNDPKICPRLQSFPISTKFRTPPKLMFIMLVVTQSSPENDHMIIVWLRFLLNLLNPFPHTAILQQTTLNIVCQKIENLHNWMDNLYDKKWKTLWQKEKLHVLCNFFFFHYVFKKLSAAEASGGIYMRERVKLWLRLRAIILHYYTSRDFIMLNSHILIMGNFLLSHANSTFLTG